MTKLAFLSLAVLTFGAFAAEPKIPAESQAVLFLANTSAVTGTILYLDLGMHLQKSDTGEKSTRL